MRTRLRIFALGRWCRVSSDSYARLRYIQQRIQKAIGRETTATDIAVMVLMSHPGLFEDLKRGDRKRTEVEINQWLEKYDADEIVEIAMAYNTAIKELRTR